MQGFYLGLAISLEAHEICLVVFLDDLLDKQFLYLGRDGGIAFPYEHDQVLQEVHLLHIQLLTLNLERIHGDRMLFRIADVLTTHILT